MAKEPQSISKSPTGGANPESTPNPQPAQSVQQPDTPNQSEPQGMVKPQMGLHIFTEGAQIPGFEDKSSDLCNKKDKE